LASLLSTTSSCPCLLFCHFSFSPPLRSVDSPRVTGRVACVCHPTPDDDRRSTGLSITPPRSTHTHTLSCSPHPSQDLPANPSPHFTSWIHACPLRFLLLARTGWTGRTQDGASTEYHRPPPFPCHEPSPLAPLGIQRRTDRHHRDSLDNLPPNIPLLRVNHISSPLFTFAIICTPSHPHLSQRLRQDVGPPPIPITLDRCQTHPAPSLTDQSRLVAP
jgi:hypothetical protein